MVIQGVRESEDRIFVDLHFNNGMHIRDEYETLEYHPEQLANLPEFSEEPFDDSSALENEKRWTERVVVPSIGKALVIEFREFQETASSRMQALARGPFLAGED